MTATMTAPRTTARRTSRNADRTARPYTGRPVAEMLLELAYRMHATRAVAVAPAAGK